MRQSNSTPNGKAQTRAKKKRQRACSSCSLTSRRLFTSNSSWQAKHSIPHTPVMLYGGCVKICKDFTPNFGDKRTGCCIMKTHPLTLPFRPGNFWPKITWLSSPTHPTCLTWPLMTFSVTHHSATSEVIAAESQVVLNTLREHDFQGALTKMAEALGTVHTHEGGLLHGWWRPVDPKISFYKIATPVLEIMDTLHKTSEIQTLLKMILTPMTKAVY
jgi:hypothetical protein